MMPDHGLGMPLDTTPFLILSSPFLTIHAPLLLRQAGWGKASPAQHNFPWPGGLGKWEPGLQLGVRAAEP